MKWFRLYAEVATDPKVQALRPELFKFWINFLCHASQQEQRGTFASIEKVALSMPLRRDRIHRFIQELCDCNLIVRDGYGALTPYKWAERQPHSDDVAKQVKDYRKKTSAKPKPAESAQCINTPPADVCMRELDREREENTPPSPPRNVPINEPSAEERRQDDEAIERLASHAKATFPGPVGQDLAEQVRYNRDDIGYALKGDWECYRAAIDEARVTNAHKPIDRLHPYCLKLARKYAERGLPPKGISAPTLPFKTPAAEPSYPPPPKLGAAMAKQNREAWARIGRRDPAIYELEAATGS